MLLDIRHNLSYYYFNDKLCRFPKKGGTRVNPIYERLFDYYAIPLLGQDHSQLQSLLAPLPLSEIQRIDLADALESLRLQWSTDAFTLGLHLGLSLLHDDVRRGRPQ